MSLLKIRNEKTGKFEYVAAIKGNKGDPGDDGVGISSVERTEGDGSAGSVDVYTITFTDGATTTFNVRNGSNGKDGSDANVTKAAVEAVLTGDITSHEHGQYLTEHQDISGKLDKSGGEMTGELRAKSNATVSAMSVRNISLIAEGEDPPSGEDGDIYFVYEV